MFPEDFSKCIKSFMDRSKSFFIINKTLYELNTFANLHA
jgi:hypothetical protein